MGELLGLFGDIIPFIVFFYLLLHSYGIIKIEDEVARKKRDEKKKTFRVIGYSGIVVFTIIVLKRFL